MKRGMWGLAALSACSSVTPPPPLAQVPIADSPPPAASASSLATPYQADSRTAKMMRRVSAVRRLTPTRVVPGVTLERGELLRRLRAHVDQEVPPHAIADEGTSNALLGLIDPKFDYEKAMYGLLEEQLAGYYEPEGGMMLLAGDLDDMTAEATLAHELVHALQDQHYDLKSRMKYKEGQSDAVTALQCLAEGDATSAMFDVLLPEGTSALDLLDSKFASQVQDAMTSGGGADAPRAMRAGLVAPYVDGMHFVNALRRHGGWAEVDRAWLRIPTTTEQILHVDKWQANELAIAVPASPALTLGAGFASVDTDTLGELGLRVTFAEWTDETIAASAAAHWGGDRMVLLRSGDQAALAWRVRYDEGEPQPGAYAEEAFAAVSAGMIRTLGPPKARDAAFVCFERPCRAPLALARAARDILLAAGPAKALDMTPQGDCGLLKRWSLEALK